MPTIEQLNFDLIIDDKKFNAQVQKALKDARDLNTQLSTLLNLRKQFAGAARNAAADERDLAKAIEEQTRKVKENSKAIQAGTSAAKAYNAARRTMKNFNMNGEIFSGSKGSLSELTSLAAQYVSILGGAKLVKAITQVTAEFELQRTTLRAILQDIEGADAIFGQIKSLAVMSPFSFKELVTYAKQLSAYSIPMGELYETTKMLADVSAGLGVGMDRLVLAYGQIRSASFLRGQEVRQLTEAGIPILEELRKQFVELGEEGITVGDVFDKISNRMVPFEMVSKVFQNMTSEGGKFYQMQEVQAETLRGKISNLKDAYDIMFDKIGNKNMGALRGAVDWVRSLAENYQRTGRWLAELVALYGTYKVALALAAVGEKAVVAVNTITRIVRMASMMKALTGQTHLFAAALRILGASGMKTALAGIAGVFALIATGIVKAIKNAGEFQRELNKLVNEKYSGSEKLANDFQKLVQRLREATVGSGDYRRAISELNNKYGEYLPNLLTEKNALKEIALAEQSVTNAIYAKAKAYTETEGMQRIEEKYGKQLDALYSGIVGFISPSLGKEQAERFAESFKNHIMHTDDPLSIGAYFEQFFGKDIYSVLKENTQYLTDVGGDYIKQVQRIGKEYDKLTKKIDNRWGDKTVYSSEAQYQAIYKIEEDFAKKEAEIKNKSLTVEEEKQALLDNEIAKLEAIKKAYEDLNKEAAELGNPGSWNNLISEVQKKLDALRPKDSTWLQRIVNAYVTGNSVNDLKVKQEDKYSEYLDNLRKEYKAVVAEVADAEGTYNKLVSDKRHMAVVDEDALKKAKQQLDNLTNRKKVIEDIGKALGVSVNDKVKTTSSSGKSEEQTELETRINTMKELLSWYEKLKDAGMGEGQIKSVLAQFFPDQKDIIKAGNYKETLLELADALGKYGAAAEKSAQGIRDDLVGNDVDSVFKAFEAYKRYNEKMKEWLEKDFGLEGEDIVFDLSKLLTGLTTSNASVSNNVESVKKQVDESEAYIKASIGGTEEERELAWQSYREAAYSAIDSVADREIEANKRTTQEKVNDLAKKYVSDSYLKAFGKSDILSKWGDKTLEQIRSVMEKITDLQEKGLTGASVEMKKKADELGISLDSLWEIVKQIFQADIDNASYERMKKMLSLAQDLRSTIAQISPLLNTLGESLDNDFLTGLAEALEMADGIADAVLKCDEAVQEMSEDGEEITDDLKNIASSTDYITMLLKICLIVVDKFVEGISNGEKAEKELVSAAREYVKTVQQLKENDYSTIFGTDSLGLFTERLEYAQKKLEIFNEAQKNYTQPDTGYFSSISSAIKTFTKLAEFDKNIFDTEGNLNMTYIKSMRDYWKEQGAMFWQTSESGPFYVSEFLMDRIDDLIDKYDDLEEANEALKESYSDLFGQLSDSIVSNLLSSFDEVGNAVANIDEAFADLGQTILNSVLQSYLLENVLGNYEDKFKTVMSEYALSNKEQSDIDKLTKKLGAITSEIKDDISGFGDVINAIIQSFKDNGLYQTESTGETLSSGISSITEDTANLLASYINAMRSDLAGHRMEVQGISADVKAILGLMPSVPTLAEYLTQIQANTYNTSANTAEILARLDSVVGDGASSYIRIQ